MSDLLPSNYNGILSQLKIRVRSAQVKAVLSVNQELIALYMEIGRQLAGPENGWGTKAVERLAKDLKAEFPDMSGFSRTNLFYMKQVYTAWKDADEKVQQAVGRIPGGTTSSLSRNSKLLRLGSSTFRRPWSMAGAEQSSRYNSSQGYTRDKARR